NRTAVAVIHSYRLPPGVWVTRADVPPFGIWRVSHGAASEKKTMTTSLLSTDQLRQQIRVRLAQGRLPTAGGVYKSRRGTGQACLVCRRAIDRTDTEYETPESGRVVLTAHEACYTLWREESVSYRTEGRQTDGRRI